MVDERLEKLIFKKHEDKFENAIINYLKKYDGESYVVDDIYSQGLYLGDALDLDFYGYIKLDCFICKNDEYNFRKTYQITFKSNLEELDKIEIINIDSNFNIPFEVRLNNDFSRYMGDNDCDKFAKDFLKKYYPEAFEGLAVDVEKVLERMNLNIEYKSISETGNIFAMIAFENMTIKTYEWKNFDEYTIEDYEVKGNTIIMDDGIHEFYQDTYKDNFTKIHECVHSVKDKKYYYFNKLFNNSSAGIFCNVNKYDNDTVMWIETQANKITSRIMMYEDTVQRKIKDFKKNNELIDAYDYKYLFDYLRNYFKCSIQALKIRLLSLGYNEFSGIYDYIGGKYVEPYLSKEKTNANETYSIELFDLIRLRISSIELKKVLSDYLYVYVDSHVCINDSKYIINKNGINHLSAEARNDVSKCCIKFNLLFKNSYEFNNFYFLRTYNSVKPKYEYKGQDKYTSEYNKNALKKFLQSQQEEISKLPNDFGESLKQLMVNRNVTVEILASDSLVSVAQIKRLRNNEDQGTKIETLLKICVGLQLPPRISYLLFEKKGIKLTQNTEKNLLFQHILESMYTHSIYEVEDIIKDFLDKE